MKKFVKSSRINNHLVIYDLETGSANPEVCPVVQIAAVVADINTLELKEENGKVCTFNTKVKPYDWSLVEDDALKANKLTREELKDAPEEELVFNEFTKFCRSFQKKDNKWETLVPCGYNITRFDNLIMNRLCYKYGYLEKDEPKLFHPAHYFDVRDIVRLWFHNTDEIPSYKMDDLRDYFGLSHEGGHSAIVDVQQTYQILRRYLEFHRKLTTQYVNKFKGCFA